MLDAPEQKVGEVTELEYDGKVKKEILEVISFGLIGEKVGEGLKKPRRNYIAIVSYKCYFFDHQEIENTGDEKVEIWIGDPSYPQALWKGIEEMRKGEKSKIKIKKSLAYGRKEDLLKIKIPLAFEEEGPKREKLLSKGIIFEIKLHDWIEREDVNVDGNFLKRWINKPKKREWEKAAEIDEFRVNLKAYYDLEHPLIVKDNWETSMADPTICATFKKILESMKRTEKCSVQVSKSYLKSDDITLTEELGQGYNPDSDLTIDVELVRLVKVEDWFKDGGSSLKKVLRKGKGGSPNIDSEVYCKSLHQSNSCSENEY